MSLSLCLDTLEQHEFGPEKRPIDHETKSQQLEKTFVISSISNLATPPASPGQSESQFVFEARNDIPSPPQTPVQSTPSLIHDYPPVTITKAKSKDISSVQKFLNQSLNQSFDASFLLQHLYKPGYFLLIASSAVDRNQGVTNCNASDLDPDTTLRNHPTDNNSDSLACLSYTDNNNPTTPSLTDVDASIQCAHREPGLVGVIAGYIQSCPACPSVDHAVSAYLSILAVHPTHQSRGIGSSLLSRLEHELKSESAKTCYKSLAAPKPKRPFGWTMLFDTDEDHDKPMTGNHGPLGNELKINQRSEPNDSSTEPSNSNIKKNDSSTEPTQQMTESSNQVASIVLSHLKSLFLDVETCNTRAQSFYIKNGFDLLGPEKKGYYKQSGKSSFLMEKRFI